MFGVGGVGGGTNDCFVLAVEEDEDDVQVPVGVVSVLPPNEEPPPVLDSLWSLLSDLS